MDIRGHDHAVVDSRLVRLSPGRWITRAALHSSKQSTRLSILQEHRACRHDTRTKDHILQRPETWSQHTRWKVCISHGTLMQLPVTYMWSSNTSPNARHYAALGSSDSQRPDLSRDCEVSHVCSKFLPRSKGRPESNSTMGQKRQFEP